MKSIKKKGGLLAKRNRCGYYFSAHWILGMLLFFIYPTFESLKYAFSSVELGESDMNVKFEGLKNFRYLIFEDPQYVDALRDSVGSILISLPIIISLSLFLALILNGTFKGRTLFRSIFFLPVILANSVVMNFLKGTSVGAQLFTVTSGEEYTYGSMIDFNSILLHLNLPEPITNLFSSFLGNIFNLIWACGVPLVLFLAGLQSISKQLYEVGRIEGANRWEMIWLVEVPMLRNIIILVLIYTMIDLFTALDNPLMMLATSAMFDSRQFDRSSAMLWGYFLIVGLLMAIVLFAFKRFCVKKWE